MSLEVNHYVKIVETSGDFHFGYIEDLQNDGDTLTISLEEEGLSKMGFEATVNALAGEEPTDWKNILTDAEKRLLPYLAEALGTKEIAEATCLSPTTVRAQVRALRLKLNLEDRAQLVAQCQGLELIIEGTPGKD